MGGGLLGLELLHGVHWGSCGHVVDDDELLPRQQFASFALCCKNSGGGGGWVCVMRCFFSTINNFVTSVFVVRSIFCLFGQVFGLESPALTKELWSLLNKLIISSEWSQVRGASLVVATPPVLTFAMKIRLEPRSCNYMNPRIVQSLNIARKTGDGLKFLTLS